MAPCIPVILLLSFARKYELADQYKVNFIGAVSWSFEFEDQPWFYGFRDLATNGVDKPVLNVFRMFGMMKGNVWRSMPTGCMICEQLWIQVSEEHTDIDALGCKDDNTAAVMVWNYHDDDMQGAAEHVSVHVKRYTCNKILLHALSDR